jgi:hypothetical protein
MRDESDEPERSGEGPGPEWLDLYPAYHAPDEPSAIHVEAMLRSAGIASRIRSAQIPAYDGVFVAAVGYWGQVLVAREDLLAARALVEEFVREAERGGPSWRWPPSEMDGGERESDPPGH